MIKLNSSAIRSADYDPASRRLYLKFTSGNTYTFYRVPGSVFLGLLNASSKGAYYNQNIRGRYQP